MRTGGELVRGDTVVNPREQEEKRRQTNGERKLLVKKVQIIDEIKVHLTKLTCSYRMLLRKYP